MKKLRNLKYSEFLLTAAALCLPARSLGEEVIDAIENEAASQVLGVPSGLLLVVVIIAVIVAFVVTGSMKAKLKTASFKVGAADYIRKDSLNLSENSDIFLYQSVNKRKIETASK